jgi:c-di-GMP-binding flagellar brake protein YcgR
MDESRSEAGQKPDRREYPRYDVDGNATIYLLKMASMLRGRILDISLGGCRIQTTQRFPVGIYCRVETEFSLDGIPFRLVGVTQSIHDRNTIGIRFLDMSERKREQLVQFVREIEGRRAQDRRADAVAFNPDTASVGKAGAGGGSNG